MVDCGSEMVPARDTIHLGKPSLTAPAVLCERGAPILLMWGPGVRYNALQLPGETEIGYDLQTQCNFAMMNPNRAVVLHQG